MFKTTKRLQQRIQELELRVADVCHETNVLHRRIDMLENQVNNRTDTILIINLKDPPMIAYQEKK